MILALKTSDSTAQMWLAPAAGSATVAEQTWESGRLLADELPGKIQAFLQEHAAAFSDLTGLAIYSGPGSFTSLRIGHTVMNALADSLGVPVVGCQGESWLADAMAALSDAQPGQPALPHYGAEANITKPKS